MQRKSTLIIRPPIHPGHLNPNHWAAKRRNMAGLGIGTGTGSSNQAQKTVSLASEGASIGATAGSVFPGIGTAIGAAVGAVVGAIGSLFGPAKEGMAAETWDDMVIHGYILTQRGAAFDERYFGEALKGAMDKGSNIWPGCGATGYKNPDCFYAPLAKVIAQGYLSKKVPLTATTDQVWTQVVVPWLQSGAAGLFNWAAAVAEAAAQHLPYSQQELLIKGAVDRYINGLPITRANMPAYAGAGGASTYAAWSTPPITVAVASLLTPPPAPAPPPVLRTVQPVSNVVAASASGPAAAVSTSATPAPNPTAPLPAIAPYQPPDVIQTPIYSAPVDQTPVAQVSATATGIPSWLLLGGGALAVFLITRKK